MDSCLWGLFAFNPIFVPVRFPEKYRIGKKAAAIGVLAVFFFAILPHDFIHDFAGHRDTVDHYNTGLSWSRHHIHCDFLKIIIAPYLPGAPQVLPAGYASYAVPVFALALSDMTGAALVSLLRGPPPALT
ncbi:hypothetical protein GCM10023143_32690 [Compostibacter hankyongensis]|uniref:Mannosyltransferase n=2 Tax=Compostibacter hankyongensis TaxID=1007089 RepID=A0ABP8G842_9BACT